MDLWEEARKQGVRITAAETELRQLKVQLLEIERRILARIDGCPVESGQYTEVEK
jgi:hypothetical protein